jgi:hypothetical protein
MTASIDDDVAPTEGRHSYVLSKVWLSFDDAETQAAFNAVAANTTMATRTAAAAILLLFATLLAIAVLEHFTELSRDNEPAILLLAASVLLAAVQLGHRQLRVDLPIGAAAPLLFCALAAATVGLAVSTSRWVSPVQPAWIGVALLDVLPGANWLLTAAIMLAAVVLPLQAANIAAAHGGLAVAVATTVGALIVIVLQRYGLALAACVRFTCAAVADGAVLRAARGSAHQTAMLTGLVPPHALPYVTWRDLEQRGPAVMNVFDQLSVLQVHLSPVQMREKAVDGNFQLSAAAAFEPVVQAWRLVNRLVQASVGGVLELAQATGDTFLLGGPFVGKTDADDPAAARAVVALLRDLHAQLRRLDVPRAFTAVATAGTASAALLGAAKLSFRLFGAVIRESCALLEAAPRMPGMNRNAAFATEAFRRQYCVTAAPRFRDSLQRTAGNMSVALAPRSASLGPAAAAAADIKADGGVFGERLLWSVKGVGAPNVTVVLL